jgi:hypothetical protein
MSKIGIVIGVRSAYSLDLPPVLCSESDGFISGTVVSFIGDEFPLIAMTGGKFDNDSTELSMGDRDPPSIGGDPKL